MKHLVTAAILLISILIVPKQIAQTSNPSNITPSGVTPPTIKFDVVDFKRCQEIDIPNKNTIITGDSIGKRCQTVKTLLDVAYGGGTTYQFKGEPAWVDTDAYNFQAKVAPEDVAAWQKMDVPAKRLMVRATLADVLNLKVHTDIQSRPVYNLVVAKGGPKLTPSKPDQNAPTGIDSIGTGSVYWPTYDEAVYTSTPMSGLASALAARLDRDVIDKTGLTGTYDFHVKPLPLAHYDPKTSDVESTDFAGIINGVESLGLKLEPAKADTTVIIVDHIDRPPEN
jgi:uncharacterized protein (TIGR03435 family)